MALPTSPPLERMTNWIAWEGNAFCLHNLGRPRCCLEVWSVCVRALIYIHLQFVCLGLVSPRRQVNSGVSFFGAYCRSQHLFLEEETKFGNTLCITYYFLRQTRLQTCVFRPLDQRLDCIPFPTSVSRHTEQASFPPRWLPRFLRPATLEPATKPKGAAPEPLRGRNRQEGALWREVMVGGHQKASQDTEMRPPCPAFK